MPERHKRLSTFYERWKRIQLEVQSYTQTLRNQGISNKQIEKLIKHVHVLYQ